MHACAVLGMLVDPLGPLGVQATRDDLFSAPVLLMLETFAQDVPRGHCTAAASWMRKVSTSIGHVSRGELLRQGLAHAHQFTGESFHGALAGGQSLRDRALRGERE